MPKTMKIVLGVVLSILILCVSFGAGCILTLNTTGGGGVNKSLIDQAWGILSQNFVVPDQVDETVVTQGAVRGMVQSLEDPYSYYLTPEEYRLTREDFRSSFGGIGASISMNDQDQVIIVAPMKDSPAEKAGILPQDIILAVDGVSTEGLTTDQVVAKVRGEKGTAVTLTVLHEGQQETVDIRIVRAEIKPDTVYAEMKCDIAYVQITNFYERTGEEFQAALEELDLKNAKGMVLDLRNNLGGIVTTMVDVAGHFIKEGVIITFRDNQGNLSSESVKPRGTFIELPLVVLVNKYSASASEVLSGAFQDYQRATIAGEVTLGKGSYDSFFNLNDGSGIYLTIGRWLTPNGREIEGKGITPDIAITETGDEGTQWAIDYLHGQK